MAMYDGTTPTASGILSGAGHAHARGVAAGGGAVDVDENVVLVTTLVGNPEFTLPSVLLGELENGGFVWQTR